MNHNRIRPSVRRAAAWCLPAAILCTGLAPEARADGAQAVLAGSHVLRVGSGGYMVPAERLQIGKSKGDVSQIKSPDFPVVAADDLNLASYFARSGVSDPAWDVYLGSWWDTNGQAVDFFVFEVGGNDGLQVAPLLLDGSVGQPTAVYGWSATGYTTVSGPNKGQMVHGLAFRSSDLRHANGSPLAPGERIAGVRLLSNDIDGAVFVAVDPIQPSGLRTQTDVGVKVVGKPSKWSPMEVWFTGGPVLSELDDNPNPFLDFRLQVTFYSPNGRSFEVPGFFDGDGQGGSQGGVWKARFTPPESGKWTLRASFRAGTNLAVSTQAGAGKALAFDGLTSKFDVAPVDPAASGFHRKGMLRHVGEHYLRFDDRTWFLKGGTNSPENLLAYFGFDEVADSGNKGILHRYAPHRVHWKPGDPDWNSATSNEDAHGLIGALNYLSGQGVNSVYMLPMNLGGDGQDVCPFVGQANTEFDKTHYDLSRLAQWEQAFRHAQAQGILLHFVLAETEVANETWLDGGGLGHQRKLFFREMVARFGHHNALKWNLCEENDWSKSMLDAFADYLRALDPYDHPLGVHNHPDDLSQYSVLAGDERYTTTAVQFNPDLAGGHVETLRNMSKQAGHKWAVELDENTPAGTGLQPNNADDLRKRVLWDAYFSGAAGIEWYFGYQPNPIGGDVDAESFINREPMWRFMRHARLFIEGNLPFHEMSPFDGLLSGESNAYGGGEVFAKPGEVYAVYYPNAVSTGVLDLSAGAGASFTKRWFNPRTGGLEGATTTVQGGGPHSVGPPPSSSTQDWVLWLKRK